MAPLIGFHSVIERPLSVSRVMPPTTTIANTRPATNKSRLESALGRSRALSRAIAVVTTVLIGRRYSLARSPPARARGRSCYIVTPRRRRYMRVSDETDHRTDQPARPARDG